MTHRLIVDYPDSLPDSLQKTSDEFEKEAKMAMSVKLFEMKRISSGIAAEMAGIDRVSFLLLLHQYNIPMINIESEELQSDIDNA